jgi:hypothetical protein
MGRKQILVAGIVAFVVIVWLIVCAILVNPGAELLPTYALAELWVSALAFLVVWLTLILITFQFRKAMAKPELKLFFGKDNNEFGENSKTSIEVNINKDRYYEVQLYLWIKNTGNAVAKTFQIDIEVPSIFDPINFNTKQGNLPSRLSPDGKSRIYSYYNKETTYFVNKPEYVDSIILASHPKQYEKYEAEYEILYRVFGDWAKSQEDKLKVICNKR